MLQEIITYLIIGAAISVVVLKLIKSIRDGYRKKRKKNFKTESYTMQHNCSNCPADCMLRNSAKIIVEKNSELCKRIEVQPKW